MGSIGTKRPKADPEHCSPANFKNNNIRLTLKINPPMSVIFEVSFLKHWRKSFVKMKYRSFHLKEKIFKRKKKEKKEKKELGIRFLVFFLWFNFLHFKLIFHSNKLQAYHRESIINNIIIQNGEDF